MVKCRTGYPNCQKYSFSTIFMQKFSLYTTYCVHFEFLTEPCFVGSRQQFSHHLKVTDVSPCLQTTTIMLCNMC